VLAGIAEILGKGDISVQSVVQRGLGGDARLVMVLHEAPESAFLRGARRDRQARLPARRPRASGGEEVFGENPEPMTPPGVIERYRDRLPLERAIRWSPSTRARRRWSRRR
jgi:hypothetical protein